MKVSEATFVIDQHIVRFHRGEVIVFLKDGSGPKRGQNEWRSSVAPSDDSVCTGRRYRPCVSHAADLVRLAKQGLGPFNEKTTKPKGGAK